MSGIAAGSSARGIGRLARHALVRRTLVATFIATSVWPSSAVGQTTVEVVREFGRTIEWSTPFSWLDHPIAIPPEDKGIGDIINREFWLTNEFSISWSLENLVPVPQTVTPSCAASLSIISSPPALQALSAHASIVYDSVLLDKSDGTIDWTGTSAASFSAQGNAVSSTVTLNYTAQQNVSGLNYSVRQHKANAGNSATISKMVWSSVAHMRHFVKERYVVNVGPGAAAWTPASSWSNLGTGSAQNTPALAGMGSLALGSQLAIVGVEAPPSSLAFFCVSPQKLTQPAGPYGLLIDLSAGGFILPLATNNDGAFAFSTEIQWPAPSGATIYLQYLVVDGPSGAVRTSNCVSIVAP